MELLLTSDNKDGLRSGVIDGGTCVEAGPWPGCALPPATLSHRGIALVPVLTLVWPWAPSPGPQTWGVHVRGGIAVAHSVAGLLSFGARTLAVLCGLQDTGNVSWESEVSVSPKRAEQLQHWACEEDGLLQSCQTGGDGLFPGPA